MAIQQSDRRSTGLVFGLSSLLLLMLLCCVVLAVWRTSREHQAECILRIHRGSAAGIVGGIQEYMQFKETQGALLQSSVVLSAAAQDPRLAAILAKENDPVRYLGERVQVDLAGGSELLFVRLRGDDPESMRIVLDGVVDAYLNFIVEDEARQREMLDVVQSVISTPNGEDIDRNELRSRIGALPSSFVRDRLISLLDMAEDHDSPEMIMEELKSMELMLSEPRVQIIQRATVPSRP